VGIVSAPAAALLAALRQQGVELSIRRGDIKVKGPARALTAETYQKLAYFQDELLDLLEAEPAEPLPARELPPAPLAATVDKTEAFFAGGLRIQVRQDDGGRWMIWFTHGAAWRRRKDFASPWPDHARRTAELWFGPPVDGWNTPTEGAK
jgi:hypothetical protein